ncbi:MAG: undecaprenyldiphospho-muramoylpentapeptide beta-N-acetylglucosaminyltransferase [Desulfosudaceae bacterium]
MSPEQARNNIPVGLRTIIAGGATGGHLFPGIAIAENIRQQNPGSAVLFISTGTDLEKRVLPQTGFDFAVIPTEGIKGRSLTAGVRAIVKLARGMVTAVGLIKKFSPDVIVGVGGYSSAPVIISGWIMGVRIALHEQNALPGVSNRWLARFADRIFISLAPAADWFPAGKVLLTGNPVRQDILRAADRRGNRSRSNDHRFTVLILGGSQGAGGINRAVVAALGHLDDKKRYFFVHQTGAADEDLVRQAYRHHGVDCRVKPFFDDMPEQYTGADFLICRAGATTVAEIVSLGKVALLVPFPHAADNHQTFNARALTEADGAEMIQEKDLTGEILAEKIIWYADNPRQLEEMSGRVRSLGDPRAGRRVAEECLAMAGRPRKKRAMIYACI